MRMTAPNGQWMHDLARRLWPLHRSITGDGTRETLAILKEHLPGLTIHEVPTGTQVFDWTIPEEWRIRGARLIGPEGDTVIDYANSNLHVLGYSEGIDAEIDLEDLQEHLHSLPDQPDAIPYVTSYYNRRWGFCLPHNLRESLKPGTYRAIIDAEHFPGSLTYGELILPGESTDEIFVTTYICHPSLANNELSGPVVATALAMTLAASGPHHYTYRFVWAPETIGAITYASLHKDELKERTVAAFNLTCIGDDRAYTYLASRHGNHRVDRIARRAVEKRPNARIYSYLERGSDERHYCAPGLDLPMVSLMRSRYADYPEYHTSHDDLEHVVTPSGLAGGLEFVLECVNVLEHDPTYTATFPGEPQLGRRGLYHTLQGKQTPRDVMFRTNILAYADGCHDAVDLSELLHAPVGQVEEELLLLEEHGLLAPSHRVHTLEL